jgi:hypothetical protein
MVSRRAPVREESFADNCYSTQEYRAHNGDAQGEVAAQ